MEVIPSAYHAKRKDENYGGHMDKRTKKELIGVSLLGTAVAIGVAYANRKKLKRSYDIKKHNLLTWKDNTTQNTLIKAEKKIKDLQDKNTSERQIAW